MTKHSKLLSDSKCNKTLEEGRYQTGRNKYERDRKLWKYADIELRIHAKFGNYFWYIAASYIG